MAELISGNSVKTIAFYLPQFHCIPENDRAYGKGFTEWTNVKKAKPLFDGHRQPRVPINENYYCLLDQQVMEKQSELAKEYGLFGFCYYHYWFGKGKKLLEKPIEAMLKNPNVDIPFCLCWANENWSKRWDGGNNELIVEQTYGDVDSWKQHIEYLIHFFKDQRYIRINNKPLLLVYKPELIPNYRKWVEFVRSQVIKYGFEGINIAVQYPKYFVNGFDTSIFDYYIGFEPAFTRLEEEKEKRSGSVNKIYSVVKNTPIKGALSKIYSSATAHEKTGPEIRDYDTDWSRILARNIDDPKLLLGGFVDWDNTPRTKTGVLYNGVTPEKFQDYIMQLARLALCRKEKCIFINAWNEWAEGAYLEPDTVNKMKYLAAVKKASEIFI